MQFCISHVHFKIGMQLFLFVHKSQIYKFLRCTSPQIANLQIVIINPQGTNPQISLVPQSANPKSANLQGKEQCF
jgi:hypothetical protein